MISVPEAFAAEQVQARGPDGARWIDVLPDLLDQLARRWDLRLSDEAPLYGAHALVLLCFRGSEPCALKVGWNTDGAKAEAMALRAWRGQGAVRLLGASPDEGALLLERLDPSRTLHSLDLSAAADVVGRLIRRLAIPAVDGWHSDGWADLGGHLARQQKALGNPLPQAWVDVASELAAGLVASGGTTLLHTDLHSDNVLAGRGDEWVAIDPRVSVGDPERATPDLLLWRLPLDASPGDVHHLLSLMTSAGELRRDRVDQWLIVRAVGHWLWCVDENAKATAGNDQCSICEPRCSRILEALT